HRSGPAAARLRPGDQSKPYLQPAERARRDLGRRAPGLYRPRARPRQRLLPGLDRKERVGCLMADFLLEMLSEEIPARMQARARKDLARLFAAEITSAGR